MDLDIIKRIKKAHLKASFENLPLRHKFFLFLFLASFLINLMPHAALAQMETERNAESGPALVFDAGNSDYQDYLDQKSQEMTDAYYQEQIRIQAVRQELLTQKVRAYLAARNSPLAEYASTLVSMRNWKKITALSNAESTLCRRYPVALANCWGVGGSDMWDMGDNLGQGVVAMNQFLNFYPKRSPVKYSEMSFERMNGLYKQPPAQHWIDNNQVVYDDLTAIEASVQ